MTEPAPAPRSGRAGVLLDVDGTLVDTNYLHALAWSRALVDAGEWAPMHAIHRLVGMGGDQLLQDLLGHDSSEASSQRAERYRPLISEARAFPGASALIRRLDSFGLAVVLATSAPADELDAMRRILACDDQIAACTTADDVRATKPAPDVFRAAMQAAALDPALTLVIGDSIWDVQAARAAGLGCIAVESGGFSAHELREEGAAAVYRNVQEILDQALTGALAPLILHARSQR